MRTRILPPEEWSRLPAEAMPGVRELTEPQNVSIVVVEDDGGEIVACLSALRVTMLEGTWVTPRKRGNAGVMSSLLGFTRAIPRERGERWAFAATGDPEGTIDGYIRRLGGWPLSGAFYVLPVGE